MIPPNTPLHDVECVEAFVAACMLRSRVRFSEAEREEMLAEGIALLYELAGEYQPQMLGYEREGSFAGYASFLLPKRMQNAWHALHPEHLASRGDDGRRTYSYAAPAISLHAEDAPPMVGTMVLHAIPEDSCENATGGYAPPDSIASALARMPVWDRMIAGPVVRLIEDGHGVDEIAGKLRIGRGRVSSTIGAVGSAIYQVNREAA